MISSSSTRRHQTDNHVNIYSTIRDMDEVLSLSIVNDSSLGLPFPAATESFSMFFILFQVANENTHPRIIYS